MRTDANTRSDSTVMDKINTSLSTTTNTLMSQQTLVDVKSIDSHDALYYAFQCVLAALIIIVNGTVLHILITKRNLHSPTNTIFGSHAAADILYGLLRPLQALLEESMYKNSTACITISSLSVATGGISMQHLTLVSLDRYIMFTRPLAYPIIVTSRRVRIATVGTWIITLMLSMLPVVGVKRPEFNDDTLCSPEQFMPLWYFIIMAGITFIFNLSLITTLYYKIFRIAYSQNQRIKHQLRPQGTSGVDIMVVIRSTHLFATLCGYFTLSWTPYFLVRFLHLLYGEKIVHPIIERLTVTVGTINSLGNPLLYALRQHDVRKQLKLCLPCYKEVSYVHSGATSGV